MKTTFQGMGHGKVLSRLTEAHVVFQIAAILILGIFWTVILHLARIEGEVAERNAIDSARELTEMYESHMVRNLGFIDQTLKTVKYAYEQRPSATVLADLEKKEMLPPKLIFMISVVDRFGNTVASSAPRQQESIAPQALFRQHQRGDFNVPSVNLVKDPAHGRKIQFSRRLNAPNGAFNGVVMLSVDPEYFTSDYDKTKLGDRGLIGLVGANGVFWAKRIGEQIVAGEPAFKATVDLSVGEDEKEPLPELYFADKVARYANAKRLFGYPLAIVVGVSKDEQLQQAYDQKQTYYWIAVVVSGLFGGVSIVVARLLVQLERSRRRSRKNQETYYAALEASSDAIYVLRAVRDQTDKVVDFIIDDLNNRGATFLGMGKMELAGARLCEKAPQTRENGMLDALIEVYQTGQRHESEWKQSIPAQNIEWLQREFIRVEDGVMAVVRDITDRKRTEERMTYMAHHDALTGLPNRILLKDRLQQAMLRAKRDNRCVTIAFLDLDNFKPINDTLGHRVGDALLKTIADRMQKCVRQTDTIVRLGGDEFLIILGDQTTDSHVLSPTLQRIRAAIAEPFYFEGNRLQVTSSMGLARYPEDGEDPDTLVLHADTAMYAAKSRGRDNYQYYAPGMTMRTRTTRVSDTAEMEVQPSAQTPDKAT